ncbi:probable methyltransferase At1g27930 [Dendrobium catenatum]|uniref:Glucuronoxylan 4-O-methyltransferase 1 n=1 Tax=Dendrobium catenatum TaxID=906689 RepID=A0A2I0WFX0_9ASPA|nr:probable methyltransferase At1g27930 [Dendrobium catenatum]PKU74532.1 Glucuronoxylan 4-O-methyltransferase 1 [Dendrobium catenatum]
MVKLPVTRWILAVLMALLLLGAFLLSDLILQSFAGNIALNPLFLRQTSSPLRFIPVLQQPSSDELRSALLHYATSPIVPQQTLSEIRVSFDVLRRRSPCNFLVFGLGHDSPMWSAFNSGGTTLFLEEDPSWFQSVLRKSPSLHAHNVRYPTKLSEANELMKSYRKEPECMPPKARLRDNRRCRLALADLPGEVYEMEWDLIMIDAPKGYFAEAPGRMGAIYSAAVMARERKGEGFTDVFLHDVDRKVEKKFAMEFLCKKYLVGGSGRLWHFRIPPASGNETAGTFC